MVDSIQENDALEPEASDDAVQEPVALTDESQAAEALADEPQAVEAPAASAASPDDTQAAPVDRRGMRKVRQGLVVSSSGNKTCVVQIKERKSHPVYGKMITTTKKLHVHDEDNLTDVGDTVSVMETRPISKQKRWRLIEIVEKAK
jgi:small subunit ribosomal protein S17